MAFAGLRRVKNAEEAIALLLEMLRAMSEAMECRDFKMDEVQTGQTDGVWRTARAAHGTVSGTAMSLHAAAMFSVRAGEYCLEARRLKK